MSVAPLDAPSPSLSGWEAVTETNVSTIAPKIPVVTSGKSMHVNVYSYLLSIFVPGTLYSYLACGVGSQPKGAFRALTRGYNYWASGHLDQLQVHTMHPQYCHVRGTTTPSMKPGSYHVHILLGRKGQVCTIETATCECAAG